MASKALEERHLQLVCGGKGDQEASIVKFKGLTETNNSRGKALGGRRECEEGSWQPYWISQILVMTQSKMCSLALEARTVLVTLESSISIGLWEKTLNQQIKG